MKKEKERVCVWADGDWCYEEDLEEYLTWKSDDFDLEEYLTLESDDFDTEEEFDDMAEQIKEVNFKHLDLMAEVKEKRLELEWAERELQDFEEDNKKFLVAT